MLYNLKAEKQNQLYEKHLKQTSVNIKITAESVNNI